MENGTKSRRVNYCIHVSSIVKDVNFSFHPPGRVGSLDTKRRHIGVAAMGNYLYAVGGSDGTSYLKSTEKYDPRLNQVGHRVRIETQQLGLVVTVTTLI